MLDIDPLVLSKEVSHFLGSHAHSHPGSVHIRSNVFGQFCHVGLTKTLQFGFGLVKGIKIGSTGRRSKIVAGDGVGKDGIKAQGLDDASVDVMSQVQGTLVGSNGARVLNTKATVHPDDPEIVNPGHTELDEPFRFHQGLGNKSVLGVAIKDRTETLEGGSDGIDEFCFVRIAALAFLDQQIGRFHSGFEPDVALTTKERFVAIRFGDFHVLVDTVFASDQGLPRSGSVAETGTASQGSARGGR